MKMIQFIYISMYIYIIIIPYVECLGKLFKVLQLYNKLLFLKIQLDFVHTWLFKKHKCFQTSLLKFLHHF